MLYEKISYPHDFPINIQVLNVKDYPLHYHKDVELVYVLRGEIKLKNGYHDYILKEGDIFTNSGHEVHGLTATEKENTVAIIQISNRFFTRYFPSLTKSCFRTYANDDRHLQLDTLRRMLLRMMLDYYRKAFDYKSRCNFLMIEAIKYMNEKFNLFAFEDHVVVNFKNDDPIIVERMSRIINHIYANHASRLTLEDLAKMEHLSAYYISHLIREHIGINFQEFLCFARVEMSEIDLLGTDKKISAIAKNVGFSTTAYYEKYFEKWFGRSPQTHRDTFKSHILSDMNREQVESLADSDTITLLQQRLSMVRGQDQNPLAVNFNQIAVRIEPGKKPLTHLHHRLEVSVTSDDLKVMGGRIWTALDALAPQKVIVIGLPDEDMEPLEDIASQLRSHGLSAAVAVRNGLNTVRASGSDSIAAFPYIFEKHFASSAPIPCVLRDQGDRDTVLKGTLSCLTSSLVPKPAMYAYQLLSYIDGDLLYSESPYFVIRSKDHGKDTYILLLMNFSEEISLLCARETSPFEADHVLGRYIDQTDLTFTLPLPAGRYSVMKYTFGNESNIFMYMSQLGFPEKHSFPTGWEHLLDTHPFVQGMSEDVNDTLDITLSARGAMAQVAVIQPE